MIADPSSLLAIALLVGILGLAVLVLPLLILFWSQMQPQLIGLVAVNRSGASDADDYATHESLPKLMKSFGSIAELEKKAEKKAKAKPAKKSKLTKTAARTKASSTTKTVKTKTKAKAKMAAKSTKTTKAAAAKKPKAKMAAKTKTSAKATTLAKPAVKRAKAKSVKKRTPAGAKRDAVLGVIYSKKPKEVDDLKEIKGVAKVIEAKLHKAGIYTFRQIVEWDKAAIDAFSDKLSFKGRIRNEGWQKQCAKFHKAKYGEKIG